MQGTKVRFYGLHFLEFKNKKFQKKFFFLNPKGSIIQMYLRASYLRSCDTWDSYHMSNYVSPAFRSRQ